MHRPAPSYSKCILIFRYSVIGKHFTTTDITTSRVPTPPRDCSAPMRVTAVLIPGSSGRIALYRQNSEFLQDSWNTNTSFYEILFWVKLNLTRTQRFSLIHIFLCSIVYEGILITICPNRQTACYRLLSLYKAKSQSKPNFLATAVFTPIIGRPLHRRSYPRDWEIPWDSCRKIAHGSRGRHNQQWNGIPIEFYRGYFYPTAQQLLVR